MKNSQSQVVTTTLQVPITLLDPTQKRVNFLPDDLAKCELHTKTYNLKELMDLRDSLVSKIHKELSYLIKLENLEESEYDSKMFMISAMEFNLIIVKEQIDIANSPVKPLIFQRGLIVKQRDFHEDLSNNVVDEGVNKSFIRILKGKVTSLKQEIKNIDSELTSFNKEVKLSLPLIDLNKVNNEKVEEKVGKS